MRQGVGDCAGVGLLLDPSAVEAKVALRTDFTRVSQDEATPLLASVVPTLGRSDARNLREGQRKRWQLRVSLRQVRCVRICAIRAVLIDNYCYTPSFLFTNN
jgi:hypothetical protein